MNSPHHKILYRFSMYHPLFDYLKEKITGITFFKGLPHLDEIRNCLLILDDMRLECIDTKEKVLVDTVGSHHRNISFILLTHELILNNTEK
jgi:hypothetical protein